MPQDALRAEDDTTLPRYPNAAALVAALRPTEPVYCLYPEVLRDTARRFLAGFPGRVLYAVKANPDPHVVRELARAGVRTFDTASIQEMAVVRGVAPDAVCCFMAPVKLRGAAARAYGEFGVRHFVTDHIDEFRQTLGELPARDIVMFVRLATPSAEATFELSSKFGATPEAAVALLKAVAESGAEPALAFNVGSLVLRPSAYEAALALCARVIEEAGVPIRLVDLGGGFPAPYPGCGDAPLDRFFAAIRDGFKKLPLADDAVALAEPGRALVAEGLSLVVQVLHRRDDRLYLNDGVYGSLAEPAMSKGLVRYPTRAYRAEAERIVTLSATRRPFTLYGPTCDSLDRLPAPFPLPESIAPGDWIELGMLGAYSLALRTRFNGFHPEAMVALTGSQALPPAEPL